MGTKKWSEIRKEPKHLDFSKYTKADLLKIIKDAETGLEIKTIEIEKLTEKLNTVGELSELRQKSNQEYQQQIWNTDHQLNASKIEAKKANETINQLTYIVRALQARVEALIFGQTLYLAALQDSNSVNLKMVTQPVDKINADKGGVKTSFRFDKDAKVWAAERDLEMAYASQSQIEKDEVKLAT